MLRGSVSLLFRLRLGRVFSEQCQINCSVSREVIDEVDVASIFMHVDFIARR